MARLNVKPQTIRTHEGAVAPHINPELQLRRSVMACMLWESQFYESGESIAERITATIPKVNPVTVANIAIEAREKMKLRHVPLLIVREMARLDSHKYLYHPPSGSVPTHKRFFFRRGRSEHLRVRAAGHDRPGRGILFG